MNALPPVLTVGETENADALAVVASEEPVAVRTRGGGVVVGIIPAEPSA